MNFESMLNLVGGSKADRNGRLESASDAAGDSGRALLFIHCPEIDPEQRQMLAGEVGGASEEWPDYPEVAELGRQLARRANEYAAIFIGMQDLDYAVKLMATAHATSREVVLVAVHSERSPDHMLAAMRAGAREFLSPPLVFDATLATLREAEKERSQQPGRVLAFLPVQGGSGASTTALHVAHALSERAPAPPDRSVREGRGVLFVDLDCRSNSTVFWAGCHPERSLFDALERPLVVPDSWPQLVTRWEGFDLLVPPMETLRAPHETVDNLAAVIDAARSAYEYVVVDLPDATSPLSSRLLELKPEVHMISTTELRSLRMVKPTMEELAELGLAADAVRLVLNRVGASKTLPADDVQKAVGFSAFFAIGNDYKRLYDAQISKRVVPSSAKLGREYDALADAIIDLDSKLSLSA